MTENQVFIALYAVTMLVNVLALVGLGLLGASDQLFGFAFVVLLCVGSLVVGQVPPWYEARRRKR